MAGQYEFNLTVTNSAGSASKDVWVTVNQSIAALAITPASATMPCGSALQFTAIALDQFGNEIESPTGLSWNTTAGSISSAGLFTAPTSGTSATIDVTGNGVTSSPVTIALTPAVAVELPIIESLIASPVSADGKTVILSATIGGSGADSALFTTELQPDGSSPQISADGIQSPYSVKALITFDEAGDYRFSLEATNSAGSTSQTVEVVVDPILSALAVEPETVSVEYGHTKDFAAYAGDQFGNAMADPAALFWSANAGTVNSSGVYTAPGSGSSDTVTVTAENSNDELITSVPATVHLSSAASGPEVPQNLNAVFQASDGSVLLTWNPNSDGVTVDYAVQRYDSVSQSWLVLTRSTGGAATFTDHDPVTGVQNTYAVRALDAAQDASNAQEKSINIPTTVLPTPTGVSVTPLSSRMIEIQWDAVTGAAGYVITRVDNADHSTIVLPSGQYNITNGAVDPNNPNLLDYFDPSVSDAQLQPNTSYTYTLQASDQYYDLSASSVSESTTTWRRRQSRAA